MAYQALYRRFRPKTFDKVIGQEHVTTTLINQIKSNKIGHAYLFCGARGTGKTSTAKIFAKAINCLSPENGSPCGKCKNCLALDNPNTPDVFEIDAASNNKVENVREIRDKISYPPVTGKYKVYIIDEVHMLTGEAFNALLKTLEEPPAHAVFILATTEVYKIPTTILSRCMRFDFRLVETDVLAKHVGEIFDEIGRSYEQDAVKYIARAGEGCVRDCLSVAEICVSFCEGEITLKKVLEVMGATDDKENYVLIENILSSRKGEALKQVDEFVKSGKSVGMIFKDLIECLRETLICSTANGNYLSLTQDKYNALKNLGEKYSDEEFLRIMEILSFAEGEIRYSSQPRIILETAILKASAKKSDYSLETLALRVGDLEKKLENILSGSVKVSFSQTVNAKEELNEIKKDFAQTEKSQAGFVEPSEIEQPITQKEEKLEEVKLSKPITENVTEVKPLPKKEVKLEDKKVWGTVIRALRRTSITLYAVCSERLAEVKEGKLIIYADGEGDYSLLTKPDNFATIEKTVKEVCSLETEIAEKSNEKQKQDEIDEQYKQVVELFGKDKIIN